MPKRQRGNKEAKKPKKAALAKPPVPGGAAWPASTGVPSRLRK